MYAAERSRVIASGDLVGQNDRTYARKFDIDMWLEDERVVVDVCGLSSVGAGRISIPRRRQSHPHPNLVDASRWPVPHLQMHEVSSLLHQEVPPLQRRPRAPPCRSGPSVCGERPNGSDQTEYY